MHLPVCRPGYFDPGIRRALACSQTLYFLLINLPRFIFYYARSTDFADRHRNGVGVGDWKKGKGKENKVCLPKARRALTLFVSLKK